MLSGVLLNKGIDKSGSQCYDVAVEMFGMAVADGSFVLASPVSGVAECGSWPVLAFQ